MDVLSPVMPSGMRDRSMRHGTGERCPWAKASSLAGVNPKPTGIDLLRIYLN